jgi:hypothetical protein
MSDFDRYDFGGSVLTGLLAVGALLLYAPLWAVVLIMAIGCTVSLFRHLDLTPAKRRRAEAEYRARVAARHPRSGRPTV